MASKTKAKTKKKGCPEGYKQVRVTPKKGITLPPSAKFKCVPIKPSKKTPGKGALKDDEIQHHPKKTPKK